MGPYCRYCGNRCFCYLPDDTPPDALKAYGTSTIIATCPSGQMFEKREVGWCYADIMEYIAAHASERKQQSNFNAIADGFAPPYPSEY